MSLPSSFLPDQRPDAETTPIPRWKRVIDLVCCALALPFFALATFLVAIVMSISSPGPIFFRQERVGYQGRRFKLYKFRTMHVGAATTVHQAHFAQLIKSKAPMLKMDAKRDTRLIASGWLLRATGLDELPQILNVMRGEMSIVGPRPCIPYEYEQYSSEQRRRFRTVPGLTGLWQVSGKNRTTFERMIELDIQYTEAKSFWMDVKIIFLTVPALVTQLADTRRARRAHEATPAPAEASPIKLPNGTHAPSGPTS
jgi:lipopolysaccharide/colanic/teichoic acid biosynthesis glycosyltransferase